MNIDTKDLQYLDVGNLRHLNWELVGGQKVPIIVTGETHSIKCQEEARKAMDTHVFQHLDRQVPIHFPPTLQIWKCTHILATDHQAGDIR